MLFKNTTDRMLRVMTPEAVPVPPSRPIMQKKLFGMKHGKLIFKEVRVGVEVPPDATMDVPEYIGMPRRTAIGERRQSILEELTLCPQFRQPIDKSKENGPTHDCPPVGSPDHHVALVPVDSVEYETWLKTPDLEDVESRLQSLELDSASPDGVHMERLAQENAALKAELAEQRAMLQSLMKSKTPAGKTKES